MQRALEALFADWMGILSGLPRLWEHKEVTQLVTSPGEEQAPHTPLAALIDAGDVRSLVSQLQQCWQAAFAEVEKFRQVGLTLKLSQLVSRAYAVLLQLPAHTICVQEFSGHTCV